MKKKLPWGEVSFLTVIVLCIAYYFFSVKGYGLKAVLWPYILMAGALLCVLFIGGRTGPERLRGSEGGPDGRGKENPRRLVQGEFPIFVIIASLLCYALLLKTLGLHLCNFLLSFFLVYYLSKGKWKTALITAVCITLAFYLIFDLSLGLRLPKGKLFKLLKSL